MGSDLKTKGYHHYNSPMLISPSIKMQQRFDTTPTFIEIGSGSYQDMPVLTGYMNSFSNPKKLNGHTEILGDNNIIDSIADAMSDLNSGSSAKDNHNGSATQPKSFKTSANKSNSNSHLLATTPAIAITNSKPVNNHHSSFTHRDQNYVSATPSSVGSYFFINPTLSGASNIIDPHGNVPSVCSSSSGSSSCSNNSSANSNDDDSVSSNGSSTHCSLTLIRRGHADSMDNEEGIQFHDDLRN